jgi:hypothetical protein
MCNSQINLSDGLPITPNKYHMQNLCLWEVDVSTNHIGVHKPFGVSSSKVRFFGCLGFFH